MSFLRLVQRGRSRQDRRGGGRPIPEGQVRGDHRRHLGPASAGVGAVRGDAGDQGGDIARRGRLRARRDAGPVGRGPGQGLPRGRRDRLGRRHQTGRPRQGRWRALGGRRDGRARRLPRIRRALRRLRALQPPLLRLPPPRHGGHARPRRANQGHRRRRQEPARPPRREVRQGRLHFERHVRAVRERHEARPPEQGHGHDPRHPAARLLREPRRRRRQPPPTLHVHDGLHD
mmetsp:Transcript_18724/g.58875  ORF Transcript_18724/g.58875 Transcript_18724/m.58875 type:complete len:231 (-) Transcript_18724:1094-1786(-)